MDFNIYSMFSKKERSVDDLYGDRSVDDLYATKPVNPEASRGWKDMSSGGPVTPQEDFYNPHTGELADKVYTSSSAARILTAFGQGAKEGWGAAGDPNVRASVTEVSKNIDASKNWSEINKRIAKSFNEAFNRPLATAFDAAWYDISGGVQAAFGASMGAGKAVGAELTGVAKALVPKSKIIAPILGEAGEIIDHITGKSGEGYANPYTGEITEGAPWGFLPEGIAPARNFKNAENKAALFPKRALESRSKGIIGEGEEGFFNTMELTPKQVEARIQAAKEAGIPIDKVTIDSPNPHLTPNGLARKIDPETFKKWDELTDERDTLRSTVDYLSGKRDAEFDRGINSILATVGGDEAALAPAMKKRLENLRIMKENKESTITTDIIKFQERIIEKDAQLRDLIPKTADARKRAQELLESDSPEGEMFRDFVQAKTLEHELRIMELEGDVKIAEEHAKNLMPSYTAEQQAKAKIKYDAEVKKYEEAKAEYKPSETGTSKPPVPPEVPPELRGNTSKPTELEKSVKKYVDDYLSGKGRGNSPEDLEMQQFAANNGPAIEAEFNRRTQADKPEFSLNQTEGIGEKKTMGFAKSVEASAVKEGLIESFPDLPEMRSVSIADQSNMIAKFMEEDLLKAKRAALGHDVLPPGMNRILLAKALQKRALLEHDRNFLMQLARSDVLNMEITESGRNLRFMQEEVPGDPVAAIKSIEDARLNSAVVKKEMNKMIKDGSLQKALDEAASSESIWKSFIKAIECK